MITLFSNKLLCFWVLIGILVKTAESVTATQTFTQTISESAHSRTATNSDSRTKSITGSLSLPTLTGSYSGSFSLSKSGSSSETVSLSIPTWSSTYTQSLTFPTSTETRSVSVTVSGSKSLLSSLTKSVTVSLSLPTETITLTRSVSLPTGTATITSSLSLPTGTVTGTFSMSLPTRSATGTFSLSLPTRTETSTATISHTTSKTHSLTASLSLPTATRTITHSLSLSQSFSRTLSISKTFTATMSQTISLSLHVTVLNVTVSPVVVANSGERIKLQFIITAQNNRESQGGEVIKVPSAMIESDNGISWGETESGTFYSCPIESSETYYVCRVNNTWTSISQSIWLEIVPKESTVGAWNPVVIFDGVLIITNTIVTPDVTVYGLLSGIPQVHPSDLLKSGETAQVHLNLASTGISLEAGTIKMEAIKIQDRKLLISPSEDTSIATVCDYDGIDFVVCNSSDIVFSNSYDTHLWLTFIPNNMTVGELNATIYVINTKFIVYETTPYIYIKGQFAHIDVGVTILPPPPQPAYQPLKAFFRIFFSSGDFPNVFEISIPDFYSQGLVRVNSRPTTEDSLECNRNVSSLTVCQYVNSYTDEISTINSQFGSWWRDFYVFFEPEPTLLGSYQVPFTFSGTGYDDSVVEPYMYVLGKFSLLAASTKQSTPSLLLGSDTTEAVVGFYLRSSAIPTTDEEVIITLSNNIVPSLYMWSPNSTSDDRYTCQSQTTSWLCNAHTFITTLPSRARIPRSSGTQGAGQVRRSDSTTELLGRRFPSAESRWSSRSRTRRTRDRSDGERPRTCTTRKTATETRRTRWCATSTG